MKQKKTLEILKERKFFNKKFPKFKDELYNFDFLIYTFSTCLTFYNRFSYNNLAIKLGEDLIYEIYIKNLKNETFDLNGPEKSWMLLEGEKYNKDEYLLKSQQHKLNNIIYEAKKTLEILKERKFFNKKFPKFKDELYNFDFLIYTFSTCLTFYNRFSYNNLAIKLGEDLIYEIYIKNLKNETFDLNGPEKSWMLLEGEKYNKDEYLLKSQQHKLNNIIYEAKKTLEILKERKFFNKKFPKFKDELYNFDFLIYTFSTCLTFYNRFSYNNLAIKLGEDLIYEIYIKNLKNETFDLNGPEKSWMLLEGEKYNKDEYLLKSQQHKLNNIIYEAKKTLEILKERKFFNKKFPKFKDELYNFDFLIYTFSTCLTFYNRFSYNNLAIKLGEDLIYEIYIKNLKNETFDLNGPEKSWMLLEGEKYNKDEYLLKSQQHKLNNIIYEAKKTLEILKERKFFNKKFPKFKDELYNFDFLIYTFSTCLTFYNRFSYNNLAIKLGEDLIYEIYIKNLKNETFDLNGPEKSWMLLEGEKYNKDEYLLKSQQHKLNNIIYEAKKTLEILKERKFFNKKFPKFKDELYNFDFLIYTFSTCLTFYNRFSYNNLAIKLGEDLIYEIYIKNLKNETFDLNGPEKSWMLLEGEKYNKDEYLLKSQQHKLNNIIYEAKKNFRNS